MIQIRGKQTRVVGSPSVEPPIFVKPSSAFVAVLVPVLNRPHRAKPLVDSFIQAGARDARLYFIVNQDDKEELRAVRAAATSSRGLAFVINVAAGRRSWAMKINDGWKRTSEPWMLLGADDLNFHRGFVDRARSLMQSPKIGVIGTADLGHPGTMQGWHSTHPFVSRKYGLLGTADSKNHLVHEGYHHNFPDTELLATARKRGAYAHCKASVVEHLHPMWGKAVQDEIYILGRSRIRQDRTHFNQRLKKFGWESRG